MSRNVLEYPTTHEALTRAISRKGSSTVIFCVGDEADLYFEAQVDKGEIVGWSAYDASGAAREITFKRVEERPDGLNGDNGKPAPRERRVTITCWVCVEDGGGGRTCISFKCPD